MKSKHYLGLVVAGIAVVAAAPGCGGDASDTTGAGGGTGTTSSSTTSSGVTSTSSGTTTTGPTTTSSSSSGGDTNTSCATAVAAQVGAYTADELNPIDGDADYFTFDGTAGQRVLIAIKAKPDNGDPSDPDYIDSVITLYDATGATQLAENDDPFPRFGQDSSVFTVLPADGTYCVRVMDFNTWSPGTPTPAIDGNYQLFVGDINPDIFVEESEANDTDVTADPISYTMGANGYSQEIIAGTFGSGTDVEYFSFTVPADVVVDAGQRATSWFSFQPKSELGSGATTDIGLAQIIDKTTSLVVAETDVSKGGAMVSSSVDWSRELQVPLTPGNEYYLKLVTPGATIGTNPFYFFMNFPDLGSNPVELELTAPNPPNDTVATAEALTQVDNNDGSFSYFTEGDITLPTDIDFFSVAVPTGPTQFSVTCGAWTSGSGLRGLTLSVVDDAGALVDPNATAVESEQDTAQALGIAIPAGATSMNLKVETATPPSATVTGRYYRCGFHFFTPAN